MFDHHLTREKALADLGDLREGASLDTPLEPALIQLFRRFDEVRNLCFQGEEQFHEHWNQCDELSDAFRRELMASEAFQFIERNFHIFQQCGLAETVDLQNAIFCYQEAFTNTATECDTAQMRAHVTRKGLFLDMDQGPRTIPEALIENMRCQAAALLGKLEERTNLPNLNVFLREHTETLRRPIRYLPPDFEGILPYRGNGVATFITNVSFRINYLAGLSGNHTIALCTAAHLAEVERMFRYGDRTAIRPVFGPGAAPADTSEEKQTNTRVIDDIFENWS